MRALIAIVSMLALLGCGGGAGEPSAEPEEAVGPTAERFQAPNTDAQPGQIGSAELSDPATDDDGPEPKEVQMVKGSGRASDLFVVTASLEEMVIKSEVIARVRLRSVEPAGAKMAYDYTARDGLEYAGSLKLTMNALEYIKGTGGAELVAYAYGYISGRDNDNAFVASTEADARELGRRLLTTRDARWDDREAIVLLRYNEPEVHYYLGLVDTEDYRPTHGRFLYQFTVAGTMWRSWLPDASPPSATSTAQSTSTADNLVSAEQRFLLDDPGSATTSTVPSIGLSEFKAKVAQLTRNYGDGSAEYRACVIAKYEWESQTQQEIRDNGGMPIRAVYDHELGSGEPAGTWMYALPEAFGNIRDYGDTPPPTMGEIWTEGRDKDLLVGEWPVVIATTRPLPAGEYRVFELSRARKYVPCDAMPEARRIRYEHVLTVTAPVGTFAESFFDPFASSTVVMGTSTIGTISWEGGKVKAEAAGIPDLPELYLDFIALDGTTTLSLVVDKAARTAHTVSWSVPTQPWSAGDKLMLRVRKSDAPSSNTAAQPQLGSTELSDPTTDDDGPEPKEDTVVKGSKIPSELFYFTASLEEMVLKADIVARVRLGSVEPAGAKMAYGYTARDGLEYAGSLKLTMNVLEYLKGTGGAELVAYAYGYREGLDDDNEFVASTEAEALELGRRLLTTRDARWDDREAIVLLRYNEPEGHYYLGLVSTWEYSQAFGFGFQFTVAGWMWRSWLPDASPPSATSTAQSTSTADNLVSVEQRFLLEDPGSAPTSTVPTIGLDELKAKVAQLAREYNGGDGSAEYRACVIAKYEWETRSQQDTRDNEGTPIRAVYDHELGSGEPAGTWVYALPEAYRNIRKYGDTPPPTVGEIWTEGRDKNLLIGEWPGVITTDRPLPASQYKAFLLWRARQFVPCDAMPDARRKRYEHVLTVTAPAGTIAESFFDPYANGTAVIGTTTIGVIGWDSGKIHATLTQDVTGHALDFIALDGSVSLSLDVADATHDSGTLVWSVATQPWSAGDKLMLRIRKSDAP